MNISAKLDQLHLRAIENKWLGYFEVFNRIVLAIGFLPAGYVKIIGERFAGGLSANHPMGHYLEALHHTGYYYPFIGIVQMIAAVLLLIPRTVTLGAVLYFPIILNICILSFAVRFEGAYVQVPLMVLANVYLLCWNYDKLKFILPFNHAILPNANLQKKNLSTKFPTIFFAGAVATVIIWAVIILQAYDIEPKTSPGDCKNQCERSDNPEACNKFCDCIYKQGNPLDKCLGDYNRATEQKNSRK